MKSYGDLLQSKSPTTSKNYKAYRIQDNPKITPTTLPILTPRSDFLTWKTVWKACLITLDDCEKPAITINLCKRRIIQELTKLFFPHPFAKHYIFPR